MLHYQKTKQFKGKMQKRKKPNKEQIRFREKLEQDNLLKIQQKRSPCNIIEIMLHRPAISGNICHCYENHSY